MEKVDVEGVLTISDGVLDTAIVTGLQAQHGRPSTTLPATSG